MPVSQCTRCDQLIDYDASHEGEEVLCPACDNITRLKVIPEEELPPLTPSDADDQEFPPEPSARTPVRLTADDLPPPAVDPVAPVQAEAGEAPLPAPESPAPAEDKANSTAEPAAKDAEPVITKKLGKAEVRILSDESSDNADEFQFDLTGEEGIRLRLPLDRPWLLVGIAAVVIAIPALLVYSFTRTPAHQRTITTAELQEILAAQPRIGLPDPEPPQKPPVARKPPQPLPPVPPEPTPPAPAQPAVKETVDVRFPTLPAELQRDGDRAEAEAFKFYVEVAFSEPYRLFGDTVTDLRTLRFAAGAGMIEFPENWRLLGGLVQERSANGLLLRLDRRFFNDARSVLIPDFPEIFLVEADQPLGLLVRLKGSRRVKLPDDEEQVVETYEFGMLPSKPMVKIAQLKAAEREAVTRRKMEEIAKREADEAATEEARKKKQQDARTVTFLRERAKKGSASAQYRLGLRYLKGEGVPLNRPEALRLLRAAAEQGDRSAKAKLKELGVE